MDEDAKVNMMNMVGGLMNGEGAGDLAGIASSLMDNMDEDTKVNMMNMVGGLMGGGDLTGILGGLMGGGDLTGMLGGLMGGGEGDLASTLGPMMGMVTSMLNGGGDKSPTNLSDMVANMPPIVEEVTETTNEETPQ